VRFQNVELTGRPGGYLVQLEGADAEHDVRDITLGNVSILGKRLESGSAPLRIGQHVRGVQFSGNAP
jgi:hypothetical protein